MAVNRRRGAARDFRPRLTRAPAVQHRARGSNHPVARRHAIRIMLHPVTIENDAISMEVWPALGGKVSSIIDKADKFELLFNFPDELPTEPQYDIPYSHS